jgi:hypothetical protein
MDSVGCEAEARSCRQSVPCGESERGGCDAHVRCYVQISSALVIALEADMEHSRS